MRISLRPFLLLLLFLVIAGCAAATAPGAPAGGAPAAGGPAGGSPRHTPADVAFVQGMLGHHRQALVMTALVPERTSTEGIHRLAERIEVSQTDEIRLMERWLRDRGEPLPAADAHQHAAMGHGEMMPGMLTAAELEQLGAARGAEFDRLFLELMIRHHEGALTMVGQLLATPGAGQEVDIYRIASEVDSDQRIEIQRMQQMLR